ncbi:fumarylacetoacetate hydrolase family protein [Nocardioides mangrovi]|uniref:Fumarylacetoacetate hydrolase family protein n=1 Tax=Nocardioides mangrovi TaxID=2874580 RepID=A0ABS7UAC6_9ACTN|nr:fumarylacetoacetate hydrolase family protein [Nocardioides mangrovi]MBZ5737936.1 fumarylacetoacetate hydrolase family protein [Nocardioides mangrovi]
MTSHPPLDPRIRRGTERMLAARAAAPDPIGWKAGFGAPASLAALEIDRPLVGFLTRSRLLPSGTSASVSSWTKPMLEAEVCAHLASDVGPGWTPAEALAAVGGWSVAIELADLSFAPTDVEAILASNIYHRHVILGPVVPALPSPLSFSVTKDGSEVATTSDPEALTGDLGFVLASTADTLAACGAGLRAGDVVITGSVIPPLALEDGGAWSVAAGALDAVSLRLLPLA